MQKATSSSKKVRFNLKKNKVYGNDRQKTGVSMDEYRIVTPIKHMHKGAGYMVARDRQERELLKKMGFPLKKNGERDLRYTSPQVLKKDGSRDMRTCLYEEV